MPKLFFFKQKLMVGIVVLVVLLVAGIVLKSKGYLQVFDSEKKSEMASYSEPQVRTYSTTIALPKPKLQSANSLESMINSRRSRREFSAEAVKLSELAQMLWSAQGISDPETGHRTAPSARESYPFTVFVVVRNVAGLKPGLYEYLPKEHALGDMNVPLAGDQLKNAGVQPGAQNAPVVFMVSASYGKAQKTLGESAVSSSLLEAGHIAENMYLQAESLRMAVVAMAGFDAKKVGTSVSLDVAETVVYLLPFGHRAP